MQSIITSLGYGKKFSAFGVLFERKSGEYIQKNVRMTSKKRIWAALKRKVTVGVRECEACQRYLGRKERRRHVALVMPKSVDSSALLALCCCYKA